MSTTITETIQETQKLILNNKKEWEARYKKYSELMLENKAKAKDLRSRFKEYAPLYYYISTTAAINLGYKLELDIRYRGQSVATLTATSNATTLSTIKKNTKNLRDFDCKIELDNVDWHSSGAKKLRNFFKNKPNIRNNEENKNNEEHNVESLLLSELLKKSSERKAVIQIQPVTFCNIRYSMPTPLKASNPKLVKYANQYGGGIDILARTKSGNTSLLTIIEVKDENTPKELPHVALNQAVRYAVFIRELLRSDSGQNWYKLFGFIGAIPKDLKIRVVCAMPNDVVDTTFANKIYSIGNDSIECHYIYFKYDGQELKEFQTSLPQK